MRIRLSLPDGHLSPEALNSALEAVTRTNESLISSGQVPTAAEGIARGVRWKPEPPGDEHFDLAPVVMGRGWGDCDDLAPWHAASLRVTGKDPGAVAIVKRSGPKRWHAVVLRSNGSIDDPSKAAGMGARRGVNGVGAAQVVAPRYVPIVPPLHAGLASPRIALDVRPFRGGYAGRVDLPLGLAALASCARAPDPTTCLARALEGAAVVGQACDADPDSLLRVAGIHDLLCGEDPESVFDALAYRSPQLAGEVVGFLPGIAAAIPMAGGLLNAAGSLFGGGGGGKAPAPAPAPAAAAPGGGGGGFPGGGGGPGWAGAPAWGPVIVRM